MRYACDAATPLLGQGLREHKEWLLARSGAAISGLGWGNSHDARARSPHRDGLYARLGVREGWPLRRRGTIRLCAIMWYTSTKLPCTLNSFPREVGLRLPAASKMTVRVLFLWVGLLPMGSQR